MWVPKRKMKQKNIFFFNTSMVSRESLRLAGKSSHRLINVHHLTKCSARLFLIPSRQTNYKYSDILTFRRKQFRNVNLIRFISFTHSHFFYSCPVPRRIISKKHKKINLWSFWKIFHSRSLKIIINWPNFEKSIWQTPNDDQRHFRHSTYNNSLV